MCSFTAHMRFTFGGYLLGGDHSDPVKDMSKVYDIPLLLTSSLSSSRQRQVEDGEAMISKEAVLISRLFLYLSDQ